MKRIIKKVIKVLLYILITFIFVHCCVYRRMTYINKEELEWVTNRHEGEMMYFESEEGIKDTIEICYIRVNNSLNPFYFSYFNTGAMTHIAGGGIDFRFMRTTACEGSFGVVKLFNDESLYFFYDLLDRTSSFIPLYPIELKIRNTVLDDVLFFDEKFTKQIDYEEDCYRPDRPIKSYAWSKKYGLVQYTYQDGETFTRTDIGN